MRRQRHHARRNALSWRAWLALLLVTLLAAAVWADIRVRPLVHAYGLKHAQTVCTRAINQSVTDLLEQQAVPYGDLVKVEKDADGSIQSVEADAMCVNRLKAAITNTVLDRLEQQDVRTLNIPLGTLTGSHLLTGRGPSLPVQMGISATVLTNIRSEFSAAGINQTCHQLYVELEAQLYATLPGEPETVTVTSEFLLAETILAGDVPGLFADRQKTVA